MLIQGFWDRRRVERSISRERKTLGTRKRWAGLQRLILIPLHGLVFKVFGRHCVEACLQGLARLAANYCIIIHRI